MAPAEVKDPLDLQQLITNLLNLLSLSLSLSFGCLQRKVSCNNQQQAAVNLSCAPQYLMPSTKTRLAVQHKSSSTTPRRDAHHNKSEMMIGMPSYKQ